MFILFINALFASIGGPGGMFDFRPRRVVEAPAPPVMQAQQPAPQPAPRPGFWQRMGNLYADGLRQMGNGGQFGSY